MITKITDFLLANANPSIRYRVLSEVLHEDPTTEEKDRLQAEILEEPIIKSIIACQKENGWLGNGFHGPNKNAGNFENQEVGTKYLGEKLVYKETPVLRRAMEAYEAVPLTDPCYRTKGKYYDEFRYAANGQNNIRCACIARAGYDSIIDIRPQIGLALDSFRRVLEVDSALDITRIKRVGGREKRVFNDYEKWPCYYHLDILAHTNSWKTEENVRMLAESFQKLMRTDRPDKQVVGDSWVGYVLGTTGCIREGYQLYQERDGIRQIYLDRVEWLCRCGLAPYLPQLREEIGRLEESVDERGVCTAPIAEEQMKGFSTYGGQQLEVDWKSATRRDCDITFRALLILHYGGSEQR